MKKSLALLTMFALSFAAAHATTILKGSAVRAELVFLNDPSQTNLLPGSDGFHGTLQQVGAGQEFVYDDLIATYTLNVNDDQLIFRVKCDTGISLKKCNTEPGFAWLVKDSIFPNFEYTADPTSTFDPADVEGIPPDIIFFLDPLSADTTGTFALPQKNSKFIIDVTIPTPEPSSFVLLGTGLLGFAGVARRRFLA